ncbi:hypothetical protein HYW75_05915 [Candidatus Pacearchaeota archaeon]|nr:hypothetical protein [Candidatus Pacearchaeota archaeon]
MATITINVNNKINQEFRKTVRKKLGERKGVLGKAIEEAIKNWLEEENQIRIAERQILMAKRGLYSLKNWKFNRDEIHAR